MALDRPGLRQVSRKTRAGSQIPRGINILFGRPAPQNALDHAAIQKARCFWILRFQSFGRWPEEIVTTPVEISQPVAHQTLGAVERAPLNKKRQPPCGMQVCPGHSERVLLGVEILEVRQRSVACRISARPSAPSASDRHRSSSSDQQDEQLRDPHQRRKYAW
jgi:hypothetical protein